MNGGDTDTGGAQVNPSTTPINTPGPRPVDAVVPDNDSDADSATTLTISHDDQPSPTLSSLPSTDSATQPSEPTMRPIIPTPSSVSTSQSTPPATNAAPVSSLGTPSTQPSTPVVPPVGTQQPTATPIAPPVSTAHSADQLISQTFASSTSSSQPTISTPVAPLQPSQPTQPLAAPSFSSQPAMQFPAASISSSSDDIILGPPASFQKSKKRPIIIGLVVIFVLVTFAGIGLIISNMQPSVNPAKIQAIESIRTSFNSYANYLLYQTDSNSPINDTIWSTEQMLFYLEGKSSSDIESYFDKLESLYATFEKTYNENKELIGDEETYTYIINATLISMQVFKLYIETPNISRYAMTEMYFRLGTTEMISQINQMYAPFGLLNSSTAIKYRDLKNDMAASLGYLYDTYQTRGCINDRIIDYMCVADIVDNDVLNIQNTLEEDTSDMSLIEWEINDDLPTLSRAIYQNIYMEKENE